MGGVAPAVVLLAAVWVSFHPCSGADTLVALTGATVHTLGPAGSLDHATVLLRGRRIEAVGREVAIPDGARRIDATGKVITPGLFDSLTQLGVVEIGLIPSTRDDRAREGRITAAFQVADAINPRSMLIPVSRMGGLTHAMVAPAPGLDLIGGQGAVIHLGMGDNLLVKSPAAMFGVLGEAGAARIGGARGAAFLRLREILQDTRDLADHRTAFLNRRRREYALSRMDLEAMGRVTEDGLPLVLTVNRASDIQATLRLARRERLHLILAGAAEGWMVAAEIAASGVPVLIDPLDNLPVRFESLGATLENAARLHAAGVTLAFMSGEAHNARNLRQAAGNAVAHGLPWEEALRAMTLTPARIWGLGDRLGSLEKGKEADLVVWDGDPLEVITTAEQVFIQGVEIPMRSRQTRLRERYRRLDRPLPPAYTNP
ncbi:MAG: amidohydrolase family protein [Acidobacteriota bacterium]